MLKFEQDIVMLNMTILGITSEDVIKAEDLTGAAQKRHRGQRGTCHQSWSFKRDVSLPV